MGNGMNKVVPGLYVGNFRDSKDKAQLKENNITHIVAVHDTAKKLLEDKEYLCVIASDTAEQDLSQHFPQCIDFIHKARLDGGCVLVHCLAGISRSVTITAAYLMTVTQLGWRDTLNAIRGARNCANPNFGFQRQLVKYENEMVESERKRFREKFPNSPFNDEQECKQLLEAYRKYLLLGPSSCEDDWYPLPHNAYKDRKKSARKDGDQKEAEDNADR